MRVEVRHWLSKQLDYGFLTKHYWTRGALLRMYWAWRLSPFSRPYYLLKTFLFLHWNARKTAVALDDCLRAFGSRMHHSKTEPGVFTMTLEVRSELYHKGMKALPNGWRWRKD